MSQMEVTFTVDTVALFDMLRSINGNCAPVGERLAGVLMTGEIGMIDELGLAAYGITHKRTRKLTSKDR